MVSEELKTIIDTLNKQCQLSNSKMNFFEEATEEQIFEFEKSNNLTLPSKFKEWLLFSDGGECFLPVGVQFYGIAHKPLIDVNDNNRPDDSYVVIGALPSGDPILVQKDSGKVSIYNQEAGRIEDDEMYDNFFAFLNDLYDILGIGE